MAETRGEGKRVVLVGHCGPDSFALRSAIRSALPGAQVEFANDTETLEAELDRADLLLINRVLDGRFADRAGVELIQSLSSRQRPVTMLISNFPDAQQAAEAAGAAPGFGKAEMYAEETRRRLREALGI